MYRIDNSTAVPNGSGVPTPAAVGPNVNGYFTGGNPGAGTPATIVDADWLNAVQEEIANVITGAGLSLSKTNFTQLLQALGGGLISGHGQCRLTAASTTSLLLSPHGGRRIVINGTGYSIPQAGISIGNSGLTASTLYYVYLYNASGTLTLELSTTTHATDTTAGNYGIEIKSGDSTRTLVGMIYTNSSSQFTDSGAIRNVASWFNRRGLSCNGAFVSAGTSSTTYVALGTAANCELVCWADESVMINIGGTGSNSTATATFSVSLGVDGVSNLGAGSTITSPSASQPFAVFDMSSSLLGEGHHLLAPYGRVSSGAGSFTGGITALFRG